MNDKKTIKKILLGLLVAIALLVGYSFFSQKDNTQSLGGLSSLLNSSALGQIQETDVKLANAEILKILGSIQNIELKDDIFTSPIFKKLKDSNFIIPKPVRIGRVNPFLPIGFDVINNEDIVIQDNGEGIDAGSSSVTNSDDDFFDDLFGGLDLSSLDDEELN